MDELQYLRGVPVRLVVERVRSEGKQQRSGQRVAVVGQDGRHRLHKAVDIDGIITSITEPGAGNGAHRSPPRDVLEPTLTRQHLSTDINRLAQLQNGPEGNW